jgi:hypothetical protein
MEDLMSYPNSIEDVKSPDIGEWIEQPRFWTSADPDAIVKSPNISEWMPQNDKRHTGEEC